MTPVDLQPALERLFQIALHIGRQARAWREGPPRSLADVALDRIEAQGALVEGRSVLVVGAGSMGRLVALAAGRRHARVVVTNRTRERSSGLAATVDGRIARYGALGSGDLAGGVVAVSGRWLLVEWSAELLANARPPVVDLSSPPAVGPELRAALGTRFASVDDLARTPARMKGLAKAYEGRDLVVCGKGCLLEFGEDPETFLAVGFIPTM